MQARLLQTLQINSCKTLVGQNHTTSAYILYIVTHWYWVLLYTYIHTEDDRPSFSPIRTFQLESIWSIQSFIPTDVFFIYPKYALLIHFIISMTFKFFSYIFFFKKKKKHLKNIKVKKKLKCEKQHAYQKKKKKYNLYVCVFFFVDVNFLS